MTQRFTKENEDAPSFESLCVSLVSLCETIQIILPDALL